jgi:hypothetical protein
LTSSSTASVIFEIVSWDSSVPIVGGQVRPDVADGHPAGIERDDHLVEAPDTAGPATPRSETQTEEPPQGASQ